MGIPPSRFAFQRGLPISQKRELPPEEQLQIQKSKEQWFPKFPVNKGDPLHTRLASPVRQALLLELAAAGAGAGLAKLLGKNPLKGLGAGIVAGAIPAGALAFWRKENNEDYEDDIPIMPPGSTVRDRELYYALWNRVAYPKGQGSF